MEKYNYKNNRFAFAVLNNGQLVMLCNSLLAAHKALSSCVPQEAHNQIMSYAYLYQIFRKSDEYVLITEFYGKFRIEKRKVFHGNQITEEFKN